MDVEHDLSVVPSPDDSRDHVAEEVFAVASRATAPPPPTLDLRKELRPVRDQGTTSTCAAQVAACIKEYQEFHDTKVSTDFSPQFVYYHRENKPGLGMFGRDVMAIMHKLGTPTEETYPFGSSTAPTQSVIDQASEYMIREYARVQSIAGLKEALVNDGPCYIAFPVFNNGTRMWHPEPGQERKGGHAMTVVGYDKKGFIIRNSWGRRWGDDGHCVYPYEDFGAHWEIWTTVDREGSRRASDPPRPWLRIRRPCRIL